MTHLAEMKNFRELSRRTSSYIQWKISDDITEYERAYCVFTFIDGSWIKVVAKEPDTFELSVAHIYPENSLASLSYWFHCGIDGHATDVDSAVKMLDTLRKLSAMPETACLPDIIDSSQYWTFSSSDVFSDPFRFANNTDRVASRLAKLLIGG